MSVNTSDNSEVDVYCPIVCVLKQSTTCGMRVVSITLLRILFGNDSNIIEYS